MTSLSTYARLFPDRLTPAMRWRLEAEQREQEQAAEQRREKIRQRLERQRERKRNDAAVLRAEIDALRGEMRERDIASVHTVVETVTEHTDRIVGDAKAVFQTLADIDNKHDKRLAAIEAAAPASIRATNFKFARERADDDVLPNPLRYREQATAALQYRVTEND
jgi:hypothetical protein